MLGFPILMVLIGLINVAYAPLCFLLRNPAVREEKLVRGVISNPRCVSLRVLTRDLLDWAQNHCPAGPGS